MTTSKIVQLVAVLGIGATVFGCASRKSPAIKSTDVPGTRVELPLVPPPLDDGRSQVVTRQEERRRQLAADAEKQALREAYDKLAAEHHDLQIRFSNLNKLWNDTIKSRPATNWKKK